MLILYYRPTCQFCQKVLAAGTALGVSFELKDISDEQNLHELIEKGGKRQVPFLIDTETTTELYESEAIIAYLEEKNGTVSTPHSSNVQLHRSIHVCDPVE